MNRLENEVNEVNEIYDFRTYKDGFNGFQALAYEIIAICGEHLQLAVEAGKRESDWASGHLSDIFGVAGAVAFGQSIPDNFKTARNLLTIGFPALLTYDEVTSFFLSEVYDPQDIVCYWGGAALACLTSEAYEPIKSRIKNRFGKKEEGLE